MAKTIEVQSDDWTTISECFEYAIDNIDPKCIDTISAAAPQLKKLSNNDSLISEFLCNHLREFSSIDYGGLNYSPNSFILSEAHDYLIIRANIWRPLCIETDRQQFEANLFAYHRPHNHNFHFLTIGHFGPGYTTDIFTYDRDRLEGYLHEKVEMTPVERTKLTKGKIMLYESGKDIHTQYPPESISVSLNLIVIDDDDRVRDQFIFDTETHTISAFSDSAATKRVSLLQIAANLANENIVDVMEQLAAKHPCHRTRLQAYKSLLLAAPTESARWYALAEKDPSKMVRSVLFAPCKISNPQSSFDPAFMNLV